MHQLTSNLKHHILTLYQPRNRNRSFQSLAHQYNIKGGKQVIQKWYKQWNGTPQSLERKKGSGRPKLLTSTEVREYIKRPIRNKNRSCIPVHYPQLLSSIHEKTGKQISIQTLRRIGKQQLGVKQKRTKKRTADESNHKYYTNI